MVGSLQLALDIADLVTEADRRLTEHEVRAEAERMLEAHPDADVEHKELALVIREEERAALAGAWRSRFFA
jgi:hypothetical protein